MAVRHRHTWSIVILTTVALLSLSADAHARGSGEVQITGPGGERATQTTGNQVQVWSCTGGKMNTCVVRHGAGGGGAMTPSGRKGQDGKGFDIKADYHKRMRLLAQSRKHR